MSESSARILQSLLTLLGTAILVFGLSYAVNWICLLGICRRLPQETPQLYFDLAVPALIIGLIAALLSSRVPPKRQMPTGMATYTVTRTTLNVLRAIEPVIMGFVLVIWVGIGPFAGVMALMLHSIADLGKLFSEQVENIDEGPVEAVVATGANRYRLSTSLLCRRSCPTISPLFFTVGISTCVCPRSLVSSAAVVLAWSYSAVPI